MDDYKIIVEQEQEQTIMQQQAENTRQRYQLSKERVGAVFSKGSEHVKLNSYILQLRLEYAAHLLINDPDRSITQVATDSGFGSNPYFSDRFRQHYGMSPTDYRNAATRSGMAR